MNDNFRKPSDWFRVAYLYLIVIALIGALLRFKFVSSLKVFTFAYILHSHSHAAMLGWVYSALYIALLMCYLPSAGFEKRSYTNVFWLTQLSIAGMLFSFAAQGYGAFSIFFSTLHILLSYWFIRNFIRDVRKDTDIIRRHRLSLKFIFAALFFLFISSFGPWGLAFSSFKGEAGSAFYSSAVYFYLHFQYNGWFTFALLGMWAWFFEQNGNLPDGKAPVISFWILFLSLFPAYILSLIGFPLPAYLKFVAAVSALAQIGAAAIIVHSFISCGKKVFDPSSAWQKRLFYMSFISLLIKFVMQLISVPGAGDVAFVSREVIIGYLHLVLLGFVTCGLFSWYSLRRIVNFKSGLSLSALLLFLAGFFFSEVLLFSVVIIFWFGMPGIPYLHHILLLCSLFMVTGLILLYFSGVRKFKEAV